MGGGGPARDGGDPAESARLGGVDGPVEDPTGIACGLAAEPEAELGLVDACEPWEEAVDEPGEAGIGEAGVGEHAT
jgi:hypothetical protein